MLRRLALSAALALVAAGCGSTSNSSIANSLSITVGPILFGIGKTIQLSAFERLTNNSVVTVTDKATWTSSDPSVVSISSSGLVTTQAIGSATITASYDSLSASKPVSVQLPVLTTLRASIPSPFTAAGQTQQLTATASFNDGSSQDVSSSTQWSSDESSVINITAGGLASSSSLGVAVINATYGKLFASATATVTPPGTFATRGRVRLPGAGGSGEGLGVPDFTITNSVTGVSFQSDATGHYNVGGLATGTHFVFTKSGFETAETVPAPQFSDVTVQYLVRITAGDTATSTIAPNDIVYDPSPSFHCASCRLIRVVNPAAGTLTVRVTWTETRSTLAIWANGTLIGTTSSGVLIGNIPVTAGELLLYIRSTPTFGFYVPFTLTTSISAPALYRP